MAGYFRDSFRFSFLVLPLLTWLIQLLNTAVYWVTMSKGHAGRDLG